MTQIGTKTRVEDPPQAITGEMATEAESLHFSDLRAKVFRQALLLWGRRWYLGKALFAGLVTGCLVAFLIPARYES